MNMNSIIKSKKIKNCLLLLFIAAFLFPIGVFAETKSTAETVKKKQDCNWSNDKIKEYFGFNINYDKDQIKKTNSRGNWTFDDGSTVQANHTYDYTGKIGKNGDFVNGYGIPAYTVVMHLRNYEPDGYNCKIDYIDIYEQFSRAQTNKNLKDLKCDTSKVESKLKELRESGIDCNKDYGEKTFEGQFCLAYHNAETKVIGAGTKKEGETKVSYTSNSRSADGRFLKEKVYNTKCEYGISDTTKVPRNPDELDGDDEGGKDYFVNKKYYYAELKVKESYGTYTYYRVPGKADPGNEVTCTRICSEAVAVEYGPPVAKKAGMCFEYKIRVTSRVDCHIDKNGIPTPPDASCTYCNPAPSCHSGTLRQGGPSDEYDTCIEKCDNGKYTKKCSDKCYKSVYGKTSKSKSAKKSSADTSSNELKAEKTANNSYGSLKDCIAKSGKDNGCYYISSGSIHWSPGKDDSSPGRWYRYNSWAATVANHGDYHIYGDGFYRKAYANGDHCQGDCHWEDCRDGDNTIYLNKSHIKSDYKANYEKWEAAVDSCNEQATCVTETSTYTISANYNDTWELFPRKDQDKDKVSKATSTENNKFTTLLVNYSKDTFGGHNGIRGCYYYNHESGKEKERMYRSTWHFPGTWMNAKTGEISYDENGSAGWGKLKDKFCIPFNTEPVNSDWWTQFFNNRLHDASMNLSYKNPAVGENCLKGNSSAINYSVNSAPGTSAIKWNIKGETRNFGYFGWNFDIECFYATPPYPITKHDKNTTNNTGSTNECTDDVRIRSIEPSNPFPEKDGGSNKSVQLKSPSGATTSVGRQPGFNWSQYATSQLKNGQYYSDPVKLIATIQDSQYIKQLYTDKYLDYQFKLSRDELLKLRSDTEGNSTNYTSYDDNGFFLDENGVLRYKSKKIRKYANVYPKDNALKCNNLRDSSHCESIGG